MYLLKLINDVKGVDFTGVQPYVFAPTNTPTAELDKHESEILASPFPKFSIENEGDRPLTLDENGRWHTDVIYCEELSPDNYRFILNINNSYAIVDKIGITFLIDGKVSRRAKHSSDDHHAYNQYKNLVHISLARLHDRTNRVGLINETGRAKYKDASGDKVIYKPRGVIYCGKRKSGRGTTHSGVPIVWKEAWSVAAHWRRLANPESLGLDRYGERCVKGFTWIGHYHKGDGEIVGKIRKVK